MTTTARRPSLEVSGVPRTGLTASWPLLVLMVLHPLWWLLGLPLVVPGITAMLLLLALVRRTPVIPVGGGCWLLLLGWVAVSFVSIRDVDRLVAGGYRASVLLTATLLLVWLATHDERDLPTRTVLTAGGVLCTAIILGGWLGVLFPDLRFPALITPLVPSSLRSIGIVEEVLTIQFATESRILGRPITRPEAPFTFTNAWGANLVLALPFLLAARHGRSARFRLVTGLLVLSSVVPIVLSMNRGLWLSLAVGGGYAAVRFARTGHPRALVGLLVALACTTALLTATSLGEVVTERAETGHSDEGRLDLYAQAIELSTRSPILGYGAPQESLRGGASVGTHGQLWLLLVSYGIPAVVLTLAWYAIVLVRTRHGDDPVLTWMRTVLVVGLVQMPFYEQLPMPVLLLVTAGALALRHARAPRGASGPAIDPAQPSAEQLSMSGGAPWR